MQVSDILSIHSMNKSYHIIMFVNLEIDDLIFLTKKQSCFMPNILNFQIKRRIYRC